MLRGHSAPIFYLFVAAEENRIFSISTDKCIKVGLKPLITLLNNSRISSLIITAPTLLGYLYLPLPTSSSTSTYPCDKSYLDVICDLGKKLIF